MRTIDFECKCRGRVGLLSVPTPAKRDLDGFSGAMNHLQKVGLREEVAQSRYV